MRTRDLEKLARKIQLHADFLVQMSHQAQEPAKYLIRRAALELYTTVDEVKTAAEAPAPKRLRFQGWARRRMWRWLRRSGKHA